MSASRFDGSGSRSAGQPASAAASATERHDWNEECFRSAVRRGPREHAGRRGTLNRLAWSAGGPHATTRCLSRWSAGTRPSWPRARRSARRTRRGAHFRLFARGEASRAGGWLGRSQRLVEEFGSECVEQGYLMLPTTQRLFKIWRVPDRVRHGPRRAWHWACASTSRTCRPSRAICRAARCCAWAGSIRACTLMDEAMVAARSGELSPVVTALVPAAPSAAGHAVYAFEHTREWRGALDTWCEARPQMVLFKGHCLVHRAQILRLGGAWPRALEEAQDAVCRAPSATFFDREAAGLAHYGRPRYTACAARFPPPKLLSRAQPLRRGDRSPGSRCKTDTGRSPSRRQIQVPATLRPPPSDHAHAHLPASCRDHAGSGRHRGGARRRREVRRRGLPAPRSVLTALALANLGSGAAGHRQRTWVPDPVRGALRISATARRAASRARDSACCWLEPAWPSAMPKAPGWKVMRPPRPSPRLARPPSCWSGTRLA